MLEALRINGSTPELKSCIAFCIVVSASQELNLGSDILICTINFQFGCNLVREEEERVQTRMARLGGWLASWGATLAIFSRSISQLKGLHGSYNHPCGLLTFLKPLKFVHSLSIRISQLDQRNRLYALFGFLHGPHTPWTPAG
jgi:hypothetical protein